MRATIHQLGGECALNRVSKILRSTAARCEVSRFRTAKRCAATSRVIVGHSARDTFEMLHDRGVYMEAKPFSLGFRIEHPQGLIDRSRFGKFAGHKLLGAAIQSSPSLQQRRAVYSFCMCPGGTVVAATSEPGRVVTNG